jgi:hypothetical protein
MDDTTERQVSSQAKSIGNPAFVWQLPWFLLHLAAVYFVVKFVTLPLAGWVRGWLLPFLREPTSSGSFEFFFSHIFFFSFAPAFFLGTIASQFKHKTAQFVSLVPAGILAYKLLTFTAVATSVLQSQPPSVSAFHQYFGGDFHIPEYRDFHDLFEIAASYPDMARGMAQLSFTAPFYAGVAYSVAVWIGHRTKLSQTVSQRVERWEQSKFRPRS